MIIAALIVLHQPSGPIYVNPEEIVLIQPAETFHCARLFKSAVTIHDKTICVLESPIEVKRLRGGE